MSCFRYLEDNYNTRPTVDQKTTVELINYQAKGLRNIFYISLNMMRGEGKTLVYIQAYQSTDPPTGRKQLS